MKGHKVATCRKLTRAQELLMKDKQRYWNERRTVGRNNALRYTKKHQINKVDEANSVNDGDYQYDEENVNTDYEGIEEINFPYSEFTEEKDLAYYNNNLLNLEQIEEITSTTSPPHALYKAKSNGYSFIAKIDSGASRNCISKSLWDKIKTSNKLAKSQISLTGARGSKLAFLGFADITSSLGKFTFTEEFAVIEGMVSDMLLGIRWEHKFNIHTGWTKRGNHYISIGKNNFVAESTNKLNVHPIIKMKGKVTLKPESISFIEVQTPRDISENKKYQLNRNTYLPNGIIPLDPIHSFEKTPRTLQIPFLNVSTNYESIPRGSFLGTFEPIDEEINEVHTTSWENLDRQLRQAHAQLRKKRSDRNAREKVRVMKKKSYEKLPSYPPSSSMEKETLMKRPKVTLKDTENAEKWKT